MNIIAVDWGKDVRKRTAYLSELASRSIFRLPFDGSVAHLIEHASSLASPVLIGIDAALGLPDPVWDSLRNQCSPPPRTFADFLLADEVPADFFEPVTCPESWSPQRPFIRPPRGRWSLQAFVDVSRQGLYRRIDSRLHANSMFVMAGISGSVGSGTCALWRELITLNHSSPVRLWPFHGSLHELMAHEDPIIGEIYPKACYGIALSESLPAPLLSIAKTNRDTRRSIVAELQSARWLARANIQIRDLDAALDSEDDFDAVLSAAALTRLLLENAQIESPDTVDRRAEGGVLGAASLSSSVRRPGKAKAAEPKTPIDSVSKTYPCPIPGCQHVFKNSRSGWDAHVGSCTRHPGWHPGVPEAESRRKLFREEFPWWFRRG